MYGKWDVSGWLLKEKGYPIFNVKKYDMNRIRAQISLALEALIEERNGLAFQRIAIQCLRSRWPSLASVAEQADYNDLVDLDQKESQF